MNIIVSNIQITSRLEICEDSVYIRNKLFRFVVLGFPEIWYMRIDTNHAIKNINTI